MPGSIFRPPLLRHPERRRRIAVSCTLGLRCDPDTPPPEMDRGNAEERRREGLRASAFSRFRDPPKRWPDWKPAPHDCRGKNLRPPPTQASPRRRQGRIQQNVKVFRQSLGHHERKLRRQLPGEKPAVNQAPVAKTVGRLQRAGRGRTRGQLREERPVQRAGGQQQLRDRLLEGDRIKVPHPHRLRPDALPAVPGHASGHVGHQAVVAAGVAAQQLLPHPHEQPGEVRRIVEVQPARLERVVRQRQRLREQQPGRRQPRPRAERGVAAEEHEEKARAEHHHQRRQPVRRQPLALAGVERRLRRQHHAERHREGPPQAVRPRRAKHIQPARHEKRREPQSPARPQPRAEVLLQGREHLVAELVEVHRRHRPRQQRALGRRLGREVARLQRHVLHRQRDGIAGEAEVARDPWPAHHDETRRHPRERHPAGPAREAPGDVAQHDECQRAGRVLREKQQSAHGAERRQPAGRNDGRSGGIVALDAGQQQEQPEHEHHEQRRAGQGDGLLPGRDRHEQGQRRDDRRAGVKQPPREEVGHRRGEPEQEDVERQQEIVGRKAVGRHRRVGEERGARPGGQQAQRPGDHDRVQRRLVQLRTGLERVVAHAALAQEGDRLRVRDERREPLPRRQLTAGVGLQQHDLAGRAVELHPRDAQGKHDHHGEHGAPQNPARARADLEPVDELLRSPRSVHGRKAAAALICRSRPAPARRRACGEGCGG